MIRGEGFLRYLAGCIVVVLQLTSAGCGREAAPGSPQSPAIGSADDTRIFLDKHWKRPLKPQGTAQPARFTSAESSLAPEACGSCHQQQFEDWQTALHSRAMSPGLFGQLQQMGPDAADDHQACLECHAPLAEQGADLRSVLGLEPKLRPPRADGVSHAHGLTCAGCHVRDRQLFGPPRRDGSVPPPGTPLPHGGWQANAAFSDSRFCAACHQFGADGPALNGKPLENTYEEWRVSRYASENRTCQSCHMPDRRHLWRGIHDSDMVRSGLTVETIAPTRVAGRLNAEISIANTGVGHAFPTYVTPQVAVEIEQVDNRGKLIAATTERHLIAREVSLDLSAELADTRLMPDEKRRYLYDRPFDPRAVAVVFRIVVRPDVFYAAFYRATLSDSEFRKGRAALREALRRATTSSYVAFEARREISTR